MHMTFYIGSSGIAGLFTALGIDWRSLILDGLAFLIVMAILAKYVYPSLIKALDNKQHEIETAIELEKKAKQELLDAQKKISKLLAEARTSADNIIATAKTEAGNEIELAKNKAIAQANQILLDSKNQIDHDIRTARDELKSETARLIALATETVIRTKLDSESDTKLIKDSINELASVKS